MRGRQILGVEGNQSAGTGVAEASSTSTLHYFSGENQLNEVTLKNTDRHSPRLYSERPSFANICESFAGLPFPTSRR